MLHLSATTFCISFLLFYYFSIMLGALAAKSLAISSSSPPSSSSSANGRRLKASLSDYPPASRVFIRNLSYSTTETSLRKAFSDFGPIVEVKVARDEDTKKSKGFAFIQYSCQDDAISAIEHMDNKIVDERYIYVEVAKPSKNHFSAYPKSLGPPS